MGGREAGSDPTGGWDRGLEAGVVEPTGEKAARFILFCCYIGTFNNNFGEEQHNKGFHLNLRSRSFTS